MSKSALTHKRLLEVLHYDPDTGVLTWRIAHGRWNRIPAGTKTNNKIVRIDGETFLTHRLIFFYMNGYWPKATIDHANVNSTDHRWNNLREASEQEQHRNNRLRKDNKSGYKNVYWNKEKRKWDVTFRMNKKNVHLLRTDDLEMAILVASEYRDKYHGEFANHG